MSAVLRRIRLTHVALVAVLAILSHAEYQFGVNVLGLPGVHLGAVPLSLALAVPAAIDTYVIAALRSGRDVPYALALTALSVAAGTVTAIAEPPQAVQLVAGAVFGGVMAVVLWRIHELDHADQRAADQLTRLAGDLETTRASQATTAADAGRLAADLDQVREQSATAGREIAEQQAEINRLTGELHRAQSTPVRKVAAAAGGPVRVKAPAEPVQLPEDVLRLGRQVAQELQAGGKNLTRASLTEAFRKREQPLSTDRARALLQALKDA